MKKKKKRTQGTPRILQRWQSDYVRHVVQITEARGGKSKETDGITITINRLLLEAPLITIRGASNSNRSSNHKNQNGMTSACHQWNTPASVLSCQLLGTDRLYTHISSWDRPHFKFLAGSLRHPATVLKHHRRRLKNSDLKHSEQNLSPTYGQPLTSLSKPLTFVTS